jgi:hypothetical protein
MFTAAQIETAQEFFSFFQPAPAVALFELPIPNPPPCLIVGEALQIRIVQIPTNAKGEEPKFESRYRMFDLQTQQHVTLQEFQAILFYAVRLYAEQQYRRVKAAREERQREAATAAYKATL